MAWRLMDWEFGHRSTHTDIAGAADAALIRTLLGTYSIEITPKQADKIPSFEGLVSPGTRVFITHLPEADLRANLSLARRLTQDNLIAVPHLGARHFKSLKEFSKYISDLRRVGVCEALVIAGGAERPSGPFSTSLDLLTTGLFQEMGFRTLFVAGHPEGLAGVPNVELAAALATKNEFAVASGITLEIVTQFGFDTAGPLAWAQRLHFQGNRLPVRFGLAGPTSLAGLMKYAKMCGVSASARFMSHSAHKVARLASEQAPDTLVCEFARQRSTLGNDRISGVHFFPFGGFAKTAAWAEAARRGSFTMTSGGHGFAIH